VNKWQPPLPPSLPSGDTLEALEATYRDGYRVQTFKENKETLGNTLKELLGPVSVPGVAKCCRAPMGVLFSGIDHLYCD